MKRACIRPARAESTHRQRRGRLQLCQPSVPELACASFCTVPPCATHTGLSRSRARAHSRVSVSQDRLATVLVATVNLSHSILHDARCVQRYQRRPAASPAAVTVPCCVYS